jgi:hypothetical protein
VTSLVVVLSEVDILVDTVVVVANSSCLVAGSSLHNLDGLVVVAQVFPLLLCFSTIRIASINVPFWQEEEIWE